MCAEFVTNVTEFSAMEKKSSQGRQRDRMPIVNSLMADVRGMSLFARLIFLLRGFDVSGPPRLLAAIHLSVFPSFPPFSPPPPPRRLQRSFFPWPFLPPASPQLPLVGFSFVRRRGEGKDPAPTSGLGFDPSLFPFIPREW